MKSRFSPSPTGLVHLGNIRTALFNALLALNQKGVFLLRIEDTDKERSEEKYTDILMEDMLWLKLQWNEGPYWQSERQAIYDEYYRKLEQEGFVYPCFCSEEQLALNRKIQLSRNQPPRYPGTCRELMPDEIEARIRQGQKPTLRFRVPENHQIKFHDLIKGEQSFNSNDIGDFIIRRADGSSSFIFCNAIDDALMEVTHALRGEDHLTNTPRQVLILRALKLAEPNYGHIPLILGLDGNPLSKRNGSKSLRELRDEGILPIALLNYLVRLGHYYEDQHLLSHTELAAKFSIDSISHSPARFDYKQLLYWQKQAVSKLAHDDFNNWLDANILKLIPSAKVSEFIDLVKANFSFPNEIYHWVKILFTDELYYDDLQKSMLKDAGHLFFTKALMFGEEFGIDANKVIHALKEALSLDGKAIFMPLRIALTYNQHGPELNKIFAFLGKDRIISRLKSALQVFHFPT